MEKDLIIQNRGQFSQSAKGKVPVKSEVYQFINQLTSYLFPIMSENHISGDETGICEIIDKLKPILQSYDSGLEDKAFSFARKAAKKEGLLPGISTGASLAAIDQKQHKLSGKRILSFTYDTGERYLSVEGLF